MAEHDRDRRMPYRPHLGWPEHWESRRRSIEQGTHPRGTSGYAEPERRRRRGLYAIEGDEDADRRPQAGPTGPDDWWDEQREGPGFSRGASGEPRFMGPPWRRGYASEMDDDLRSGTWRGEEPMPPSAYREGPSGPDAWAYAGLGVEPDVYGEQKSFRGIGPKGYQRSDERIHTDVCDLLTDHPNVDASEMSVRVEEGVVYLSGRASDRWSKRAAEDLASEVRGVHDVINQLSVHRASRAERIAEERPERQDEAQVGRDAGSRGRG